MTKEVGGYTCDSVGKKDASSKAVPEEKPKRKLPKELFEPPPLMAALCTYLSYAILIIFGHIADFLRMLGFKGDKVHVNVEGAVSEGKCSLP